jgi:F-type H+-transporting ATPase subunit c
MLELSALLHYSAIALTVAINSVGVGIGEGIVTIGAIDALNIQPSAKNEITKTAVLGMALVETAAIMGVTIAIIVLMGSPVPTLYSGIAELGIVLAICLPGFIIGLVSALPAYQACLSVARQPFFSQKILRFMLITQSLIQTPIIFGFIIALFIKNNVSVITTLPQALQYIAGGLCIGLGSIGPAWGMAHFGAVACKAIGTNRNAYNKLLSFTFVSEAIIETPVIFALVISLLIIFSQPCPETALLASLAMLSAAVCTGIGTVGPGISSGKTAAAACQQIARDPNNYSLLSRASMFGQGLIDTCAIYALLVSIMLIIFGAWR